MEGPGSSCDNQINKVTIEQAKRFEPYMNGREVFKNAVVRFPEVIYEALEKNNLSMDDISLITGEDTIQKRTKLWSNQRTMLAQFAKPRF